MTLYHMLARTAGSNPGQRALISGDRTMRYAELLAAVDGFAGGLGSLGTGKRPCIGLMMPNCPEFVIAYTAASQVGTVVPLNVLYRPDEVRHVLEDCQAEVLITAEPFRPLVEAVRPHLPKLRHVVMLTAGGAQAGEVDFGSVCELRGADYAASTADDVAVILYTSGTTGRPKGAMLTHANLAANSTSCAEALPVGPDDCFLSALPLFHSFAAMVFMILPIMVGGQIRLMERFMPSNTLALMEESGATLFGGVPSMFVLMLQVPERPKLDKLRIAISGGAPLSPDVWQAFEATFDAKMIEGYGLTEASPVVAVNPPFGLHKYGSVGLPLPGVDVKITDGNGQEVPSGEVGELLVRGGNVMKGYLNRPQDTASVLRDGWLLTGDLARRDEDGYLYIAGRKKELIIVGGLNVYPGEVERVLVEHPDVLEAAAFGVDDRARGEAVWAAVVLRPDHSCSDKDLRAFCREKLASYKVPRGIEIRTDLPKNALGKVTRHVLREEVESLEQTRADAAEPASRA